MSAAASLVLIWILSPNGVGAPPVGKPVHTTPRAPSITCLAAASPERALSGAADGRLRLWSVTGQDKRLTSREVGRLPGAISAARWSSGSFVVADDQGAIATVTTSVHVLGRHPEGVRDLAVGPQGLLATAGNDGTIRLWSLERRALIGVARGHQGPVSGVAFDSDPRARTLWSVGWDKTLRRWRVPRVRSTARSRPRLHARRTQQAGAREMCGLAITPDGERLLTACFDGTLRVWTTGRKPVARVLPQRPHQEWVRQVRISTDGRLAVAAASAESSLLVLRLTSSSAPHVIPQPQPPSAVAFLDATSVLVGRFDGSVMRVVLPAEAIGE